MRKTIYFGKGSIKFKIITSIVLILTGLLFFQKAHAGEPSIHEPDLDGLCFVINEGSETIMIKNLCEVNEFTLSIYHISERVLFEERISGSKYNLVKIEDYAVLRITFSVNGKVMDLARALQ